MWWLVSMALAGVPGEGEAIFAALHAEDCRAELWVNGLLASTMEDGISSERIDVYLKPGANTVRVEMQSLDGSPHERCSAELGVWSQRDFPGLDASSDSYFSARVSASGVFELPSTVPAPLWSRAEAVDERRLRREVRRYLRRLDGAIRRGDDEALSVHWEPAYGESLAPLAGARVDPDAVVTTVGDLVRVEEPLADAEGMPESILIGRVDGQWRRMF